LPKNTRNFEGRAFNRFVTSPPRTYDRRLKGIAHVLRKRGFNARLVKNVTSSSLYIRPRTYNTPIPETSALRMKTFPIALENIAPANSPYKLIEGLSEEEWGQIRRDLGDTHQDLIQEQMEEIKQELANLSRTKIFAKDQEWEYRELTAQAAENIFTVMREGEFSSNLTSEQWSRIMSNDKIKGVFESDSFTELKEEMFQEAILTYLGSKGIDTAGDFRFQKQGDMFRFYVDGGLEWSFSDEVIQDLKDSTESIAIDGWKRSFVKGMRSLGSNEHSAYWELVADPKLTPAHLKNKITNLQYHNWDGWNLDLYEEDETPIEVPEMVILDDLPEEVVESIGDLSQQWLTEITIKTNEVEKILSLSGLINDGASNKITKSLNTSAIQVGARGGKYIVVDGIKQYIPQRAFGRELWTKPRTKHRRYNYARNKIANYLYDRMETGKTATTSQIQDHLVSNMRQPPLIQQTGNWLAGDTRFQKAGFEGWPARNIKWTLSPPKGVN